MRFPTLPSPPPPPEWRESLVDGTVIALRAATTGASALAQAIGEARQHPGRVVTLLAVHLPPGPPYWPDRVGHAGYARRPRGRVVTRVRFGRVAPDDPEVALRGTFRRLAERPLRVGFGWQRPGRGLTGNLSHELGGAYASDLTLAVELTRHLLDGSAGRAVDFYRPLDVDAIWR